MGGISFPIHEDRMAEKDAEIARLRERLDNYINTIGRENIQLEEENDRLRAALFTIQCEQLDRATDTDLSAQRHRKLAMATRDRIITILFNEKGE